MKSSLEIESEAKHLMALGRRYRDEQRRLIGKAASATSPSVLMHLMVATALGQGSPSEVESVRPNRREWFVEGAMDRDQLVFRLVKQELTMSRGIVLEAPPALVMLGDSAFDVLRAGYELAEAERLSETLAPYFDHADHERADRATVAEVEKVMETHLLSPAERQRAKAEIVEFLSGRLETSAFIAHAIQRQLERHDRREQLAEWPEIKLSIGEP
jgi:hypothetical protein